MRSNWVLALFAIVTLLCGTQCKNETRVPDCLVGVWETSHPKYADRPFEITKDTLMLEYGGGYFDFEVYPIVNVERIDKDGQTLFILTYTIRKGLEYKFSFYYSSVNGGLIRFKNQKRIRWTKKTTS